jgi:hypothetical protein
LMFLDIFYNVRKKNALCGNHFCGAIMCLWVCCLWEFLLFPSSYIWNNYDIIENHQVL